MTLLTMQECGLVENQVGIIDPLPITAIHKFDSLIAKESRGNDALFKLTISQPYLDKTARQSKLIHALQHNLQKLSFLSPSNQNH